MTTSKLLAERENPRPGNRDYLNWLRYVYPRFEEYVSALPNKTHEEDDKFKFPLEMFCVVNIPEMVSSILRDQN